MTNRQVINRILDVIPKDAIVVATTGLISRWLYATREERGQGHENDFLNVGAMGYASAIGFGLALGTKRKVVILDGDGACLMHLGNIHTIGFYKPKNLIHILLDNECYESTGGQQTTTKDSCWNGLFQSLGYENGFIAETLHDITKKNFKTKDYPFIMIAKTEKHTCEKPPRPKETFLELKRLLMKNI